MQRKHTTEWIKGKYYTLELFIIDFVNAVKPTHGPKAYNTMSRTLASALTASSNLLISTSLSAQSQPTRRAPNSAANTTRRATRRITNFPAHTSKTQTAQYSSPTSLLTAA